MSDQTLSPRKSPSAVLLIGGGGVLLALAGILIFLVLNQLLDVQVETSLDPLTSFNEEGARMIDPPREVADFTLPTQSGGEMALSDLRGRYVLMYFGYTSCPDICPLTLMDFRDVRELLGEDADKVDFLFISVDAERDNTERLANYFETRHVDDFMLGMVGDAVTLRRIGVDYDLFYEKQDAQANGYYTVDHTANMYLLNPEGQLMTIFAFGTEPEVMAQQLQEAF